MRVLVLLFLFAWNAHAQVASYELHLSEALIKAKNKSELLKSKRKETLAAREKADATDTGQLPRLSLDGNLRYVTEVPKFQAFPNGPEIQFGDHLNYTIGPTLTYTLWDGGAVKDAHKGQIKLMEARQQDERTQVAQVLAAVKFAYVNTQLGLEQVKVLGDSLKLAELQSKDISNRKKAGAASELDLLSAQKEVLAYQVHLKQRQMELSSSLRDLLALVEVQAPAKIQDPAPKGFKEAGLWLTLDSLDETMKEESRDEPVRFDKNIPQVRSQDLLAESFDLLAQSQKSSLYPQIQISARTSLDYPNGPILKRIHQNTLSLGFSLPLYEFSKTQHLVAEKTLEAEAARHRRNQTLSDIERDFDKAKEILRSLRKQDDDAKNVVKQSVKLAELNYEAYRFGRINLVDVQAANLRSLQAKVDLAQIHAKILAQLIILKTLAVKDEIPL